MNEKKSINETIKMLNKKYDAGTILKTVDFERAEIKALSTNSFSLDYVLGCGGIPFGRIIEIAGEESSGKSTLALYIAAQFQKANKKVVFLDPEYAFSASYAKKIGVDIDSLFVSQSSTGEETFDIAENLIKTGDVDLIIIDSVAALLPGAEMEKEISQTTIALQARLMSRGLRRITGIAARAQTTVIFLNQMRDKVGVFFGEKTVSSGGKALKFYASIRIKVRKGKKIKDGEEVIGNWLELTSIKNKVAMPWRTSSLELIFAKGIDLEGDLLDVAEKNKIIEKIGVTYTFNGRKIGVGRDKAKENLRKDVNLFKEIKISLNKYNKKGEK